MSRGSDAPALFSEWEDYDWKYCGVCDEPLTPTADDQLWCEYCDTLVPHGRLSRCPR